METILEGLSVILEIIDEFLHKKVFNNKIKLVKRIPYILLYIVIMFSLIYGIIWLGILLIKDNNLFGYIFILISLTLIVYIIYSLKN